MSGYGDRFVKRDVYWCSSCLNMSTRPRLSFDENGKCGACQSPEEKNLLIGLIINRFCKCFWISIDHKMGVFLHSSC